MKAKHCFGSMMFLMVMCFFTLPAFGQGKDQFWDEMHKKHRAIMCQELGLSPEKTKGCDDLEERYGKERQEIVDRLRKSQAELQNALAAPTPNDAKIKGLTAAILADQDNLTNSFKSQRDEEFAMMSPVQQGKYIMLLHKWREEMIEEHMKLRQR